MSLRQYKWYDMLIIDIYISYSFKKGVEIWVAETIFVSGAEIIWLISAVWGLLVISISALRPANLPWK